METLCMELCSQKVIFLRDKGNYSKFIASRNDSEKILMLEKDDN